MTSSLSTEKYGAKVAPLLTVRESMELGPGKPDKKAGAVLDTLQAETMFEKADVLNRNMARCCLSGLWLLHGWLDESHTISQSIGTSEGSYWHGLMHRKEPDYSNAKYWFGRAGYHPVMETLADRVPVMIKHADLDFSTAFLTQQERWNPDKFVDLCQAVLMGRSEAAELTVRLAVLEWELLFDYCYRGAIGRL